MIRKKSSDGELITPDNFIPYYEMKGVIKFIDMFVLESVCKTMRKWHDDGLNLELKISINLSSVTLMAKDIVNKMVAICEKYKVPHKLLMLEVTENICKMDLEQLKSLIGELQKEEFALSLEHLGSKYQNFDLLNDITFQTVKIDKALVEKLDKNEKSRIIMRSTIDMCREIDNIQAMAEGIETKEQANLLMDCKCEYGQGYYYSRPISLEDFEQLLK